MIMEIPNLHYNIIIFQNVNVVEFLSSYVGPYIMLFCNVQ